LSDLFALVVFSEFPLICFGGIIPSFAGQGSVFAAVASAVLCACEV